MHSCRVPHVVYCVPFTRLHVAPCILHLACLAICLAASCALAFMPNAHLHQEAVAVLVRRVHLRHSPARPERTAYVYIFNADSQVRPHAAILAPPPACACLRSSRSNPCTPAVRSHVHTPSAIPVSRHPPSVCRLDWIACALFAGACESALPQQEKRWSA